MVFLFLESSPTGQETHRRMFDLRKTSELLLLLGDPRAHPPSASFVLSKRLSVVSHARQQTRLEPVICRLSVRSPVSPPPRGAACPPPSISSSLFLLPALNSEFQRASGFVPPSPPPRLAAAYPLPSVSLGGRHLIGGVPASFVLSSKSGGTLWTLF